MSDQYQFIFKSKELKCIHDLNQIVKKLFSQYIIIRDSGLIIPDNDGLLPDKGTHFTLSPSVSEIMEMLPDYIGAISLDAKAIFDVVKEEKKKIRGIEIDNEIISFILKDGDDSSQTRTIGRVITGVFFHQPIYERILSIATWINENTDLQYDSTYVDNLMNKELVILTSGRHRVRITRELIPNLSKTSTFAYEFADHFTDNPDTFNLIVSMEKGNVMHYHIYTCFDY